MKFGFDFGCDGALWVMSAALAVGCYAQPSAEPMTRSAASKPAASSDAPPETADPATASAGCATGGTADGGAGLWKDACVFGLTSSKQTAKDTITKVGRIIDEFVRLQDARDPNATGFHPTLLQNAADTYDAQASVFPELTQQGKGGTAFLGLLEYVKDSLGDKRSGLRVLRVCDLFVLEDGAKTTWVFTNIATQSGLTPILATELMSLERGKLVRHDFAAAPENTIIDPGQIDQIGATTLTTVCRNHPRAQAAVERFGAPDAKVP